MSNSDIAQKLWNLCDVLRDDGTNYSDYVTELVLLLFIKMARPVFFNDRCRYGRYQNLSRSTARTIFLSIDRWGFMKLRCHHSSSSMATDRTLQPATAAPC